MVEVGHALGLAGDDLRTITFELGGDGSVRSRCCHPNAVSVYRKLEVNDRAQAVLIATERGWL